MILIPMISGTAVTFWICAVLAILGAVGLVTFTKPVYSALCLALVMVSLAVIYASLGAPFLFAVQIIVYTGAVLMLFLFVVMLVGVDTHDSIRETLRGHRVAVALAGIGVLALLVLAVVQGVAGGSGNVAQANDAAGGNVQGLAGLIFSRYVIAFEATAALLITAAVAAMVLAHPEQLRRKIGQTERAAKRLEAYAESGVHPGPQPNSGVFARHNSIATPALLPDGTIAAGSVSPVLAQRVVVGDPEELWAPHDEVLAAIEADGDDEETAEGLIESDLAIEDAQIEVLDESSTPDESVPDDSAADQGEDSPASVEPEPTAVQVAHGDPPITVDDGYTPADDLDDESDEPKKTTGKKGKHND
ncbi:MAG: NADH-quinone oxidoreductase subunit J [Propionibacteriaceae bacterium]|jgi:NADH-quinone oxidoreductase subunit J|nr:NADH-quinone oxidoreductase subunit J [Propionibacteriaceae bacterium]